MIFYVISFTISLLSSIGQKEHERQNECYNTHTHARIKLIYNQYNPNLIVRLWGVRSYLANHNYTTIRQFRTFMYAKSGSPQDVDHHFPNENCHRTGHSEPIFGQTHIGMCKVYTVYIYIYIHIHYLTMYCFMNK